MRIDKLAIIKWVGAGFGIVGAVLVAMNIPNSGYGFVLFSVSAICWTYIGWKLKELSLVMLNLTFLSIDILGMYRWLIV